MRLGRLLGASFLLYFSVKYNTIIHIMNSLAPFKDPAQQLFNSNPSPYLKGGIDTNDVLRAKLDPDFFEGYCIGTIHKRLHEATSRYRNDPQGRRNKYQAVLYYAQLLVSQDNTNANTQQPGNDLSDRFSRMETTPSQQQGIARTSAPPS